MSINVDRLTTEEPDFAELVLNDRVHGSLYTDPAIFHREMEVLFQNQWVFVGHESEIREPGDYVRRRIGGQPVIVARGKDNEIRVMLNRCTHRGNMICQSDAGNATLFRCSFHGWTFSNDGRLQGVSFRQGYDQDIREFKSEFGLAQASQVGVYGGFVFANLVGDAGPFDAYIEHARDAIDRLNGMSPEGRIELRAGWMKHDNAANWKIVNEVQVDGYHPLFVHESVYSGVKAAKVDYASDELKVAIRDLGAGHTEVDYSAEYREQDREFIWFSSIPRERVPQYISAMEEHLGEEETHRRLVEGPSHTFIWPNLFLAEMQVMFVEPLSVTRSIQYTSPVSLVGADEMNARIIRQSEGAMGPAGFLIADDAEMGERNQIGLTAQEPEWVLFSRGFSGEREEPRGTTSYDRTSETSQRGMWRHYRELMSADGANRG
jgi:phenylpropionate dioxygenase-like ring-hydroxylating dioxygenase large terminal subunit